VIELLKMPENLKWRKILELQRSQLRWQQGTRSVLDSI
jgi:hypothetical protein